MEMERHKHILMVGGSGMLAEATRHLAQQTEIISVIGRSAIKLKRLFRDRRYETVKRNLMSLDYSGKGRLRSELERAIDRFGPIEITVAWIHNSASKAPQIIMNLLQEQGILARYFEISGSEETDILKIKIDLPDRMDIGNNLLFRKIVLGHKGLGEKQRWLTHEEICGGVIDAVASDRELTIVGELGTPA